MGPEKQNGNGGTNGKNGNGDSPYAISFVIPTGSMEAAVLELLEAADWRVTKQNGSRGYENIIQDPRFREVTSQRPQEIPLQVFSGRFDLGLTGQDWVAEQGLKGELAEVCTLPLTKSGVGFAKIVLAVLADSDIKTVEDLRVEEGAEKYRVSTEYPHITEAYFKKKGIDVEIDFSHGATEVKPCKGLCDAIVELTETGTSLAQNNLKVIDELMRTTACLVATRESLSEHRETIKEIVMLLSGTVSARGKALLKFHFPESKKERLLELLPRDRLPTFSPLMGRGLNDDLLAVEIVVPTRTDRSQGILGANMLIPRLKKAGAVDVIEIPLSKQIP